MTPINRLKQVEYQTGAKLAFENFDDLLEISEKASQLGKFGTASSLCVLALEELTKSVILKLKAINNSIPIKDLNKYFTSHETKHNAGLNLYSTINSKYEDNSKPSIKDEKTNLYQLAAIALIAIWAYYYANKEVKYENSVGKSKSFFDIIKESGFYVGYDESARQWNSPKSQHDKKSYEGIYELTCDFS